jgi:hypothetical protein
MLIFVLLSVAVDAFPVHDALSPSAFGVTFPQTAFGIGTVRAHAANSGAVRAGAAHVGSALA